MGQVNITFDEDFSTHVNIYNQILENGSLSFNADINANATDNRVFIEAQNVSVTSWTTETYCQEPAAPPVEEFNMIVKKGNFHLCVT